MPLASTRKVMSRRGTPAGCGSMGIEKRARLRLSLASSRSPWSTWTSTDVWLSTAVVKFSLTLTGIVTLRSIRRVNTPPMVSIPSDSGITSRSSMSRRPPVRMPAWMPAPSATTSSGSMRRERHAAEDRLHGGAHERDARGAADGDHLADVRGLEPGVLERLPARARRALDEIPHQCLELLASDGAPDRLSVRRDELELGLRLIRQRALRALRHRQHL